MKKATKPRRRQSTSPRSESTDEQLFKAGLVPVVTSVDTIVTAPWMRGVDMLSRTRVRCMADVSGEHYLDAAALKKIDRRRAALIATMTPEELVSTRCLCGSEPKMLAKAAGIPLCDYEAAEAGAHRLTPAEAANIRTFAAAAAIDETSACAALAAGVWPLVRDNPKEKK